MAVFGERVFLRILSASDVSEAYRSWMSDDEVVRYLECRWRSYTLEDLREFVESMNRSPRDVLFGIFERGTERHVGNIKIGNIDPIHRFADVGLLIGDRPSWGKGYGSEAIRLACRYAREELNLHKLTAGIYASNEGSRRAFLKAGFREAGLLKEHRLSAGAYVDEWLMEVVL